ncbi:MAG: hypothetical protein U5O15_07205 [Candidatus Krumholzibacteriota bacterium]|nr:hypothetical protein [Candidatus Krumholzibacteriota bacterium]
MKGNLKNETSIKFWGIKAENARWLTIHGITIEVENKLEGLAVSGIYTGADNLSGFSASAVNCFYNRQTGITAGIFNYAENLSGVQIGLLNIARNNPAWARYLPVFNAHID